MFFMCAKKHIFLFSLHVHHGGSLVVDESCECYIDGKVRIEERLSPDTISLVDLYKLGDKFGYSKNCVFWGLRSGHSNKDGLMRLEKNALYCLLARLTGSRGTLNVYFDHSLETLGEEEEVEQPMHEQSMMSILGMKKSLLSSCTLKRHQRKRMVILVVHHQLASLMKILVSLSM